MYRIIYATVFVLGIASCSSTYREQPVADSNNPCACIDYLKATPRPPWVGVDDITPSFFLSSGVAQCSSLSEHDFSDSALNARGNLTSLLKTSIDKYVAIRTSDQGGSNNASIEVSVEENSKLLLQQSTIYARWLDPKTCTLHSAVRLSKKHYDEVVARLHAEERSRVKYKPIQVGVEGKHAAENLSAIHQLLFDAGARVVRQNELSSQHFSMIFEFSTPVVTYELNRRIIESFVSVRLLTPRSDLLWSHTKAGKVIGLTQNRFETVLLRAQRKALKKMLPALKTALDIKTMELPYEN